MDVFNRLLDVLFYNIIAPFFYMVGQLLELVLIKPLVHLHLPLPAHIMLLAILTVVLAFWLRGLFKVEEKVTIFNTKFSKKRQKQQELQLISEKYSREALYNITDDELNADYNTFIAQHYVRFASIYLLPIFLILGWLNTIFSESFLQELTGNAYVFKVPINHFGVTGVSVTGVFLLSYVVSLIVGFQVIRRVKGLEG